VAFGDYDRDGDLDIATANCYGANQNNALYKNEGNANAWLTVKAVGKVSNFSAIGAKVKVKATINGKSVWQVRQVAGQSGYCGQNLESHFGLGNATVIDSLVVIFPSGQTVVQTNVTPKQVLTITETRPAGYFRGQMQIGNYRDMSPVTIQFYDITYSDPAQPANSWKWDLNGDGIIDTTTSSARFQYTVADTYSVMLIVSNGSKTDTIRANDAIIVDPSRSIISFSTATHNFGTINVNTPVKDTTMYIYNRGKLADSVTLELKYGSSLAGTVKPDSALSLTPMSFVLAPNDSQAITFAIFPPKVVRTNLNITYTPKFIVNTKFNTGVNTFEKTMWVKLTGTLVSVTEDASRPNEFLLEQNYPNPFNPSTTIRFEIAEDSDVSMSLFDSIGREVRTLVREPLAPGRYAVEVQGEGLASGMYICRLSAGGTVRTITMVLLK
jgi:PKD repeat protein